MDVANKANRADRAIQYCTCLLNHVHCLIYMYVAYIEYGIVLDAHIFVAGQQIWRASMDV